MSWVERIKSNIKITTGDGKVYEPLYFITEKSVEYNIATFEFPNIEGTLVKRGTPKGARYTLELIFQGDDHLDQRLAFEESNKDNRPWIVNHPIYDKLILQPTSLTYDPRGLNTSRITGEMIETITDDAPKVSIDPAQQTSVNIQDSLDISIEQFSNNVQPGTSDINQMADDVANAYSLGSEAIMTEDQSNEYFDLFNIANAAILDATSDVGVAVTAMQDVLIYPFLFEDAVKNRINLFRDQFLALSEDVLTLTGFNSKTIYATNAGYMLNGIISASITPLANDYTNVTQVFEIIDIILDVQNQYISNLNSIQSPNGGQEDSYIPEFTTISSINNMVNFAVSQLFVIALSAQQERVLFLEHDSNPVLLAHRFYGLEADDSTITQFIDQNNIGLSELLEIKKDRRIVYYV